MKRILCLLFTFLMFLSAGCPEATAEGGGADARVITDQLDPVIESVTTDRKTYYPGDTVYITVRATDDTGFDADSRTGCTLSFEYSGIDEIYTRTERSAEPDHMEINGTEATVLFSYYIPEGAVPGTYRVSYIFISDRSGNTCTNPSPNDCRFTVKNKYPAPTACVSSFKVRDRSVSRGDTVRLKAVVYHAVDTDDLNEAVFTNDKTGDTILFRFYQTDENTFEASETVPEGAGFGTYRLDCIRFCNSAGVTSWSFPGGSFKVTGEDEEKKISITSMKVNKTRFRDDDGIRITLKTNRAIDDPESCDLGFSSGNAWLSIQGLTKVGKNEYVATRTVEPEDVAGAYTFDSMYVSPSDPWVTCTGEPATFMLYDRKFVRLKSFTLNKEKMTVYLKFNSDESPVRIAMDTWKPSNASVLSLDYESSNPKVGRIDAGGNFYALRPGKTVITATAKDGSGLKASCRITVRTVNIEKITLNKDRLTMKKGEVKTLTAKTVPSKNLYRDDLYWMSSDTSVANVDSAGNVTALSRGKCTISAWSWDDAGASASCRVTVK